MKKGGILLATNDLTVPLRRNAYGFALCFIPRGRMYGAAAGRAVIAALKAMQFSGRCEYYTRESFSNEYIVALGLKNANGKKVPDYDWWELFAASVASACDVGSDVRLHSQRGELAEVAGLKKDFIYCGVVQFLEGAPIAILDDHDSWFVGQCHEVLRRTANPES